MDDKVTSLINDYVDGSLDEKRKAQLSAMLASDSKLAADAQMLVRQRRLCLCSRVDAPEGLSEAILSKLAGCRKERDIRKMGARRYFNAAAVLLMAAVLTGVLVIVAGPFLKSGGYQAPVSYSSAAGDASAVVKHSPEAAHIPTAKALSHKNDDGSLLSYHLEFMTGDIVKTERVLTSLFYEYGLLDGVSVKRAAKETVYKIECTSGEFAALAKNMSPLWRVAQNSSLEIKDYAAGSGSLVKNITQSQLAEITEANDVSDKLAKAQTFAAVNSLDSRRLNIYESAQLSYENPMLARPVMVGASTKNNKSGQVITASVKIQREGR